MEPARRKLVAAVHKVEAAGCKAVPAEREVLAADRNVFVDTLDVPPAGTNLCVVLTLMSCAELEDDLARGLVGLGFVSGKRPRNGWFI